MHTCKKCGAEYDEGDWGEDCPPYCVKCVVIAVLGAGLATPEIPVDFGVKTD